MNPVQFPELNLCPVDPSELVCSPDASSSTNSKIQIQSIQTPPDSQIVSKLLPRPTFRCDQRHAIFYSQGANTNITPASLSSFDLNNPNQKQVLGELRGFLTYIQFDEANRQAHSKFYGVTPLSDEINPPDATIESALLKLNYSSLPNNQKFALRFLMYGDSLTGSETETLFADSPQLFEALQKFGLIISKTEGGKVSYRLNNLTLVSHRLPNQDTIYLFADLPERMGGRKNPEAEIVGETSYVLLHRLQKSYESGAKYSGRIADFGSGVGIQHVALLKLNPEIERAYALEIVPHSMNLNRLNALLNGVEDRTVVIDNQDPKTLQRLLGEDKLSLAVSNPPYNTVPTAYKNRFSGFGYGGEHGLDVTQIFLAQAIPLLGENGEFVFYSILTRDEKNEYHLTQLLRENGTVNAASRINVDAHSFDARGVEVHYEDLKMSEFEWTRREYAEILSYYMQKYYPQAGHSNNDSERQRDAKDLELQLRRAGVASLTPRVIRLVKKNAQTPPAVQPEETINIPVLRRRWSVEKPGEVRALPFIETGGERIEMLSYKFKALKDPSKLIEDLHGKSDRASRGGVYIEAHEFPRGGVYEQMHQEPSRPRGERGKEKSSGTSKVKK